MKKTNINYRPDIDGLRAIAILIVLFFHAGFSFFSGGFVGVDVFFVISGYLITSTIDNELIANNFSFKQFYLRRIRRIIPVLVFVILASIVPAYCILLSNDFESYSRTLIHTLLSTNNFHLWVNQKEYFSENADLIPFLHTWSLSVEEQFYCIWPITLLVLHKYVTTKNKIVLLFFLVLFGLILSIYLAQNNPNMAFYLLPARFFELAIGAFLALVIDKLPSLSKIYNHIISIIGLLLITTSAIMLNKLSVFPGINAFFPCFGTALLIFSGKSPIKLGVINVILQNKIIVFIGLLSYSIYLWHWPLFIFIKYLGINFTGIVRIISLVAIFILSYLSWKFIEQPFRFEYKFNFNQTVVLGFLPSLVLLSIFYGIVDAKDGFPERFPELKEFNPDKNYPNVLRKECFDKFKVGNCDQCNIGVKKDSLDGVLIGDSFANQTAAFLDVLAKDAGLYIHDSAAGFYPLMNSLNEDGTPVKPLKYAQERLEFAKQFKTIYIAANWEIQPASNKKNYESILKTIEDLLKLKKDIVIFDCLRTTTEMNLHKLKLLKTGRTIYFSERDFSIPFYKRPNNYIVYEMKRRFPSILIIDLNDAMCNDGKCGLELENTIVYRNFSHLNTSGAKLIAEKYLRLKGNPLKNILSQ